MTLKILGQSQMSQSLFHADKFYSELNEDSCETKHK